MKILNKNLRNYSSSLERIEAGIVLSGQEVKAIREGHANLTNSYVKIIGSEAYLVNAKIFPYKFARTTDYDEARTRKLLLHKKEIIALKNKIGQGNLALVPLSIYTKQNLIKLELGITRGKKTYEKKRLLKEKDIQRQAEQELKELVR